MRIQDCLKQYSLRMLEAIGHARDFALPGHIRKSVALKRLAARLADVEATRATWETLPDEARAVLRHLGRQAAPVRQDDLVRRFGSYRAYKPWTDALCPWESPISPVERLLYAGLICAVDIGTPKHPLRVFLLPDEITAALAPLIALPISDTPSPPAAGAGAVFPPLIHEQVCHLLCYLNARDVRPTHGRWMPPTMARDLAVRLGAVAQQDGAGRPHSERQHPRLAFVHYLAERAGLLGLTVGLLKPSLSVQGWLGLGAGEQIRALWDSWLRPAGADALWHTYRLPWSDVEHPHRQFLSLLRVLRELNAVAPMPLAALLDALARHDPYLLRPTAGDANWRALGPELQAEAVQSARRSFGRLLAGPLAWFGLFRLGPEDDPTLHLTPLGQTLLHDQPVSIPDLEPSPWHIAAVDEAIEIAMPGAAPFSTLWSLSEIAVPAGALGAYHLTRTTLLRALDRGYMVEEIVDLLAREGRDEPDPTVLGMLYTWAQAHRQVVLRRPAVLEVRDADLLRHLSAVRRIRDHFTGTLSAHAVTIRADRLPQLVHLLERRGLHVSVDLPAEEGGGTPAAGAADRVAIVAALRLAADLAHRLGRRAHIPHPLYAQWQAALTAAERAAADAWVEELLDAWQRSMDQGMAEFQAPFSVRDTIPVLEQAIREQATVEMVYHVPGRAEPGDPAPRRVDPLRLEQWGRLGTWYLVAFCHRRGENRTFRLDRISAVRLVRDGG